MATTRIRYLDFLRALSILTVVLGHWLIAVVALRGGELETGNLLALVPPVQWLTWGLQVMPVFFLVGGYVNAASWASARRDGTSYGEWVSRRGGRLLRPAGVLLAVWIPLLTVLAVAGVPAALIRQAGLIVATPLWFLAVYVVVVAAVPLTAAAHERFGVAVVAGLVALVVAVDVAHHVLGIPMIGWTNFAWVWLAAHQLGYLWRDGTLQRHRVIPWLLVAGGLVALALLVGPGPYALSMVGADDGGATNNAPPTVALLALATWQTGLALLAQASAERWLRRPRVWAGVIAANSVAMTLYLWHLSALIVVVLAVVLTGLWPSAAALGPAWWALRPVWLLLLATALVPFVLLFGRVERRALLSWTGSPTTAPRAVAGVAAVAIAIALLIRGPLGTAYGPAALFGAGGIMLGAFSGVRVPCRRRALAEPAANRAPRP